MEDRQSIYAAFRRLLLTRPARRFPAVLRACFERAFRDAPERPSLFNAFNVAWERLREGFCRLELCLPVLLFLLEEALPVGGGGSFTPAFRAFERPIAMACLGDRTPCLPSAHDEFLRERILPPECSGICLRERLPELVRSFLFPAFRLLIC